MVIIQQTLAIPTVIITSLQESLGEHLLELGISFSSVFCLSTSELSIPPVTIYYINSPFHQSASTT